MLMAKLHNQQRDVYALRPKADSDDLIYAKYMRMR
jgi:hypothetical protein